jgi:hypothetical protein
MMAFIGCFFVVGDQKRAATTIGCGAVVVIGEPLYRKVPTPGRLPSGEPANEEPASTKPKARMRLSVRMEFSLNSVAGVRRRRCEVDNHGRFRA